METFKENVIRRAEEVVARRTEYGNIPSMEVLQDYVKRDVETRRNQSKPKGRWYHETRGKLNLSKTKPLEMTDFDEELLHRAFELYEASHPDLVTLRKEKEAQVAAEQEAVQTTMQEYIRLREEMKRVTQTLVERCGSDWAYRLNEYEKTGTFIAIHGTPLAELNQELLKIDTNLRCAGFAEMIATTHM
jgi:hypothetical protein